MQADKMKVNKIKVATLTGPLLDYWVAKAEGLEITSDTATNYRPKEYKGAGVCVHGGAVVGTDYSPSTDWSQGGPILEREMAGNRINFSQDDIGGGHWGMTFIMPDDYKEVPDRKLMIGRTLLQATMRAYVVSKFGEEVDEI